MSGHWDTADVPTMWASARYGDTETGWNQVLGWQTLYELLDQRQLLLQQSRDQLAADWPPERSPAARAFMTYLDGLLASMDQAKQDAVFNQYALTDVLRSLANSRIELAQLNDQWSQYESEEAGTRASLVEYSPSANGDPHWREKLNAKGRVIMNQTDADVLAAKGAMSIPVPFPGDPFSDTARPLVDDQPNSGESFETPLSGNPSSVGGGPADATISGSSSGKLVAGNISPGSSSESAGPGGSVDLSGSQSAASGTSSVDGGKSTSPHGDSPGVERRGLGLIAGAGAGALGVIGYGRASGTPGSGVRSVHQGSEPPAMRPGVNPVGGVIGSESRPAGHGAGMMPTGGPPRRRERPAADRVAYQEWTVERGVPSVLEPGPEPRHEPGPGVIGIDR